MWCSIQYVCLFVSLCVSGSLATSVFDSDAVLVGASGGVYALIAAHLPSVFLVSSSLVLLTYISKSEASGFRVRVVGWSWRGALHLGEERCTVCTE